MLRLGLRLIKGLDEQTATTITTQREKQTFTSLPQFRQLTQLPREQTTALASANAFNSLTENRYLDTWLSLNGEIESTITTQHSPGNSTEDNTYSDYSSTGLTLREHPIALLRRRDRFRKHNTAWELAQYPNGQQATIIGLVTCRQRPGSAAGVMFLTLEDETGVINVVLWEKTQQRYRMEIKRGNILQISGRIQINATPEESSHPVVHLVGQKVLCLEWAEIQSVRSFH
ncbi:OB-fold nucleic acid binding domain-containing protein [Microbulbifer taiwanensis]|uniref:helix-hairpin-helix domain-containing protein n=1 Tax=Microbulbifer taiwanensis TaxID=986746 RepID=UPI003622CD21